VTRRVWRWIAGVALVDAVAFALTVHATADYHPSADGPTTTLGQVLGWIVSIILLIVIVLIVLGARQAARYRDPHGR
jgi:uncharacterized membrane protein